MTVPRLLEAGSRGPSRPRRLDASMTLLVEVTERPLDPGYAAAHERRRAEQRAAQEAGPHAAPPPARVRRRLHTAALLTAVLAALAGVVVTGAVMGLKTPSDPADRAALVAEIDRRTRAADQAASDAAALRAQVQAEQDALLAGIPGGSSADAGLLVASGTTEVTGPGLVVTLADGPGADGDGVTDPRDVDPDVDSRVQDGDLQRVANGLWSAGAEAVAVNGQRLTAASAIRSAGGAVLVNFRPLTPPYRVEAIGSPNALATSFALTPAARWLQALSDQYGIGVDVSTADDLDLPALDAQRLYSARVPEVGTEQQESSP